MPTPEQEAYRAGLPVHPDQHRTGAVPIDPSPKDYPAYLEPRIWANARAGDLQPVNLLPFVKEPRYDQGATGACVPNSTAGNCTLSHSEADGSWPMYAAQQLYAEAGGTGQNGVDARTVLEICRRQGTPLQTGGREVVVQSYVFVDTSPGVARTQIKAALAAGLSVLVAALLPIPFSWNSGTELSQGYHQFLVVGWMVDAQGVEWFILVNSWGDNWPGDAPAGTPNGVGRIRCDVLESAGEQGFFYAIVPTDLKITPPVPTPTPTPIPTPTPTPTPDPSGFVAQVIAATNAARRAAGLNELIVEPHLTQSAQDFAQYMGAHNQFGHDVDGSPLDRMLKAGLPQPVVWGENIAAGQADPSGGGPGYLDAGQQWHLSAASNGHELTGPSEERFPEGVFTDWMNSPGHKANLLFPGFTHFGVGFAQVQGSQYGTYWVQDFAALGAAPTPTPTPIPDPTPTPTPGPTPTVWTVIGTATGEGPITIGDQLALTPIAGAFRGNLKITAVSGGPTPTPTPAPTPTPTPDPAPVGDIQVMLTLKPSAFRNTLSIVAYTGLAGKSFPASVSGTVTGSLGTVPLGGLTTHGTDGPSIWTVQRPAPWGEPCTVIVNASNGTETGSATKQDS